MERCCVTSRAPQPSGLQDPSIPSRAVGLNSMSKSRDAFPAWPGCCARTPLDQIRRASNAAIGPPRPPSSPPRQPVHAVAARLLSSAMRSQSPRPRLAGDAALSWQCIRPVRSKTTASPLISWLFFFSSSSTPSFILLILTCSWWVGCSFSPFHPFPAHPRYHNTDHC